MTIDKDPSTLKGGLVETGKTGQLPFSVLWHSNISGCTTAITSLFYYFSRYLYEFISDTMIIARYIHSSRVRA